MLYAEALQDGCVVPAVQNMPLPRMELVTALGPPHRRRCLRWRPPLGVGCACVLGIVQLTVTVRL